MNDKPVTQTQLVAAESDTAASNPPVGFFAIGIVINVLLVTAYAIWAWRQWKKSKRQDD